jgi:hypothetical protein
MLEYLKYLESFDEFVDLICNQNAGIGCVGLVLGHVGEAIRN